MSNFEEEEQIEQIKRWWRENWLALMIGLGVGFGAIGSWTAWKGHRETVAVSASRLYEDLKTALASEKSDEAKAIADKLASDYAQSSYAVAGALAFAWQQAKENRWDEAAARLNWAREHAEEAGLRDIATLRLAQVQWQAGKADEALSTLGADAGAFNALFDELRGDIQLAQGDRSAARSSYEKALAGAPEDATNRDLLKQKLDDLGAAPAANS